MGHLYPRGRLLGGFLSRQTTVNARRTRMGSIVLGVIRRTYRLLRLLGLSVQITLPILGTSCRQTENRRTQRMTTLLLVKVRYITFLDKSRLVIGISVGTLALFRGTGRRYRIGRRKI